MVDFQPIRQAGEARAGGGAALQARLARPKSAAELRAVGDDRDLAGTYERAQAAARAGPFERNATR